MLEHLSKLPDLAVKDDFVADGYPLGRLTLAPHAVTASLSPGAGRFGLTLATDQRLRRAVASAYEVQ